MSIGMRLHERHHLFDTPMGALGITWSDRGLTRLHLPEADSTGTTMRLRQEICAGNLPTWGRALIADIHRYLAGERVDFGSFALDLSGVGEFHRTVYGAARTVGWGKTTSYGDLARRIGFPWGARAVGQTLGRNPLPLLVPCHRILTSDRRIGGFSAHGGKLIKQRLLALEGVELGAPPLPGLIDSASAQSDLAGRERAP